MRNRIYFIALSLLGAACATERDKSQTSVAIVQMNSPTGANSAEPFLFTDSDSTVYLSWVEKVDTTATFKFSKLSDNNWSEPSVIAQGSNWFVNWADYPMIAGQGQNLVAHFLQKSGESTYAYDVRLTSSADAGKTWMTP